MSPAWPAYAIGAAAWAIRAHRLPWRQYTSGAVVLCLMIQIAQDALGIP